MTEKVLFVAVGGIVIVGVAALLTGHDGTVLTSIIGAVTGLVGYYVGKGTSAKS